MDATRHLGYDYFTSAPGEVESMLCRVCAEKMQVRRNVNGPTGFAEAIAGSKHLHDAFACPNSGHDWHDQAIELMEAIDETPSRTIADLIKAELKQVVREKKATK